MNAQSLCSPGLIAVVAVEDTLDEALLKFLNRFVKKNAPLYHLSDKPVQLVFHVGTLRSSSLEPLSIGQSSRSRPARMR